TYAIGNSSRSARAGCPPAETGSFGSGTTAGRDQFETVKPVKFRMQGRMSGSELIRRRKEGFAGDCEELVRRFGGVGVQHGLLPGVDAHAEAPVFVAEDGLPAQGALTVRQRRPPVAVAIQHVEFVGDLVRNQVEAVER